MFKFLFKSKLLEFVEAPVGVFDDLKNPSPNCQDRRRQRINPQHPITNIVHDTTEIKDNPRS